MKAFCGMLFRAMTKAEYKHLNEDILEIKGDIKTIETLTGLMQNDITRIMTTMRIKNNDKLRNTIVAAIAGLLPSVGIAIYVLIQLN